MTGAMSEPYYTDEDVIGSKYKYHRPICPCIRSIEKTNQQTLAELAVCRSNGIDAVRSV